MHLRCCDSVDADADMDMGWLFMNVTYMKTQTDRQADSQTGRQTNRQTGRLADR